MAEAVRALTPVQQICPLCGDMLAVLVGRPRRETHVVYVETLDEWKRGANVDCKCGTLVFCVPHLVLEAVHAGPRQ